MTKMSQRERSAVAALGGLARAALLDEEELSVIGRKAGKVGGEARALALTKERRQEIARKAAAARWGKKS
jgi:general stress protein YciG